MMTAICLGISPATGISRVELAKDFMGWTFRGVRSNRHQLCFFCRDHLVDFGDVPVGELLDLVLRTSFLVFGHGLAFEQFLERMIGVAARVAHGDLGIFPLVLDYLDQIAAALLRETRHWNPYHVSVRRRIQAKIGLADGLLDRPEHLFFPRRYPERTGVEEAYVGDLRNRHLTPVVVHRDVVE